jgi:hypothetical protein
MTSELAPQDYITALPGPGGSAWDLGFYFHPAGSVNYAIDGDYQTNNGIRGGLEHTVELNIPNADIDTWFNWKTGWIPSMDALAPIPWRKVGQFPFRVPNQTDMLPHDYCDEMSPDYEFAILSVSRNPNVAMQNVSDGLWFYSTHPGYGLAPSLRNTGTTTDMGIAIRGETTNEKVFRIHNHEWDYLLGRVLVTSLTPYLPAGRLRLDEDQPWRITGPASSDYTVILDSIDHTDPPYSLPMENITWPVQDGSHVSTEYIEHRVIFDPRANGLREAVIEYPVNDATYDPLKNVNIGIGQEPPTGGNS